MLDDLLVAFGVEANSIPKLWEKPESCVAGDKELGGIHHSLSAIHSTLEYCRRQLLPGKHLTCISEDLLGNIDGLLRCEVVNHRYGNATCRVSLKDICSNVMVDAITQTWFGAKIFNVQPDLVQHFLDFNDDAWMLIFRYPQLANSKLSRARHKILQGFVNYIQSPDNVRSKRAWFIEQVMKDQESRGIREEDRAALLLMIYWA